MLFTLDKLIAKFVKQLQTLMADDLCSKLYDLFRYEASRSALFGCPAKLFMHAADSQITHHANEPCTSCQASIHQHMSRSLSSI